MVKLDEILTEARSVAQTESLYLIELDRTDYAIKLRLLIDQEIFIQIYANETSDKLNMALINNKNRLYGFDKEGGFYHIHPFKNPDQHIPSVSQKNIETFVKESLNLLIDYGLL